MHILVRDQDSEPPGSEIYELLQNDEVLVVDLRFFAHKGSFEDLPDDRLEKPPQLLRSTSNHLLVGFSYEDNPLADYWRVAQHGENFSYVVFDSEFYAEDEEFDMPYMQKLYFMVFNFDSREAAMLARLSESSLWSMDVEEYRRLFGEAG